MDTEPPIFSGVSESIGLAPLSGEYSTNVEVNGEWLGKPVNAAPSILNNFDWRGWSEEPPYFGE